VQRSGRIGTYEATAPPRGFPANVETVHEFNGLWRWVPFGRLGAGGGR